MKGKIQRLIFSFLFLAIILGLGCEVDTVITVSEENPPKFTFSGSGGLSRLFVGGPYSEEEAKLILNSKNVVTEQEARQLKEAIPGNRQLWELDPANVTTILSRIPALTYGVVSKEFNQVYPENNAQPMPLLEGRYYRVTAPSYSANFKATTFVIRNNKAITSAVGK